MASVMDNIIEIGKRKKDMMELWKETFHDSNRYVDIVFNAYFSKENTFVRYHENRLIAALLCIPYEFQILAKAGEMIKMKGMYLCGLATHPDYRGKGIMSQLMKEAEHSALERGFDFAFLIPADSELRAYYGRRGYRTSSFRSYMEVETKGLNTECVPYIYTLKEFIKNGKSEVIEELAEWCRQRELDLKETTIVHSRKDIVAAIMENENSILLSKMPFNAEYPNMAEIMSVVFPELPESRDNTVSVVVMYNGQNIGHRFTKNINEAIGRKFCAQKIVYKLPISGEVSINGKSKNAHPYAMLKYLRVEDRLIKNENMTFRICLMLD